MNQGLGPGVGARTVLVVEDEPLLRELIVPELEEAGYVVVEAETAEHGLEILERQPVGLLFTDIRLPGAMDGWRLAEAARALNPALPVLYATGYSTSAPRLVARGILIRKPYAISQVVETIGNLITPVPDRA